MKKLISLLLVFSLLASMLAVSVFAEEDKWFSVDGTEMTLAEWLDGMSTTYYSGKTVTLLKDITLADDFTTVPNFKGTFDGNGHSVSNLKVPLFNRLDNATIKNITLNGSISMNGTEANGDNGGAFASRAENVTFENCVSNVDIFFTPRAVSCVGGLVGFSSEGGVTFQNCVSNGNIKVDYTGATLWQINMGGLIGRSNTKMVAVSCVHNGNVECNMTNSETGASTTNLLGGFVGDAMRVASFTKCVNNGNVTILSEKGQGGHKIGGFVGLTEYSKETACSFDFTDCINTGDITSYVQAAGFAGTITNVGSFKNCYNYGKVTSGGDSTLNGASYAGGFVAFLSAKDIGVVFENCVNYGDVLSKANLNTLTNSDAGAIAGYATGIITATGAINRGTVSAAMYAGGLFGYISSAGVQVDLTDCFFGGSVSLVENPLANSNSGAMIGFNKSKSEIYSFRNVGYLKTANQNVINGTEVKAPVEALDSELDHKCSIRYEGLQYSAVQDGKADVRFVVSVDGIFYRNYGFEICRMEENGTLKTLSKSLDTVYESLSGFSASSGATVKYTAELFGADYLGALVINQVPMDQTVTFVINPFLTDVNGEVIYGAPYTVTFVNGVLQTQK